MPKCTGYVLLRRHPRDVLDELGLVGRRMKRTLPASPALAALSFLASAAGADAALVKRGEYLPAADSYYRH